MPVWKYLIYLLEGLVLRFTRINSIAILRGNSSVKILPTCGVWNRVVAKASILVVAQRVRVLLALQEAT